MDKTLTVGGKYCTMEPLFVPHHWLTADKKDASKNLLSVCTRLHVSAHNRTGTKVCYYIFTVSFFSVASSELNQLFSYKYTNPFNKHIWGEHKYLKCDHTQS
jgi:hypothetical protein